MEKGISLKLGLSFDLIIESDELLPIESKKYMKVNPQKNNEYRSLPYHFKTIKTIIEEEGFKVQTEILEAMYFNKEYKEKFICKLKLRDYQEEALKLFKTHNNTGVVILPTAAGKTMVALKAIEKIGVKTLVIVPVLALVDQWTDRIAKYTHLRRDMIGKFADNDKEIKEVTVTTYASARLNLNILRKHFGFIIFDECHHLPAQKTKKIAEGFPAFYRLGLTATPKRDEKNEDVLTPLIGPEINVANLSTLSQKGYVAQFDIKTIQVPLSEVEREKYEEHISVYQKYLKDNNIKIRSPQDFTRYLIFQVNKNPEAKKALTGHRKARRLVFSSKAKIEKIEELLEQHKNEKIVLFSEFNDMVHEISKTFLIPAITHETKTLERQHILEQFNKGNYSKLVVGKILDEGWDCGDINIGVIVSGTGQARQYIQRLGRILRPKQERAVLYELITAESLEIKTGKRRKKTEVME